VTVAGIWYRESGEKGMAFSGGGAEMTDFGKLLIGLGLVLVVVGALVMVAGRTNLPLGRLPGDVVYRGKNATVYFPLATSVVVSVVLTVALYLVGRWRK
jgi:hypothetical protein